MIGMMSKDAWLLFAHNGPFTAGVQIKKKGAKSTALLPAISGFIYLERVEIS